MSPTQAKRAARPPSIRIPPGPEQVQCLEAIEREIRREGARAHRETWGGRVALIVAPDVPRVETRRARRSTSPTHLTVFFAGDELRVTGAGDEEDDEGEVGWGEGRPLSGVADLRPLLASMRERMLRAYGEEQKRGKIRKLEERAIETQVVALAERMRFSYALRSMATKIKLAVRLDERVALYVDIPRRGAQAVIDQLETLVTTARALHAAGARFEVTTIYEGHGPRRMAFRSAP